MAKKKPMSEEERKAKKRECERRRRERIKQSVEATEELRKLKHSIHLKAKEDKICERIKSKGPTSYS